MTNHCLECKDPIKGRADKKFCSDACRNAYNNQFTKDTTNLIRNINRILRKNRSILSKLNPNGKSKATKKTLLENGFDFGYHTNTYTNKQGKMYYFWYEQGVLPLENDFYALVIKTEYGKA
jgi:predicted nucleic acid-binding Zn ribbon protein